jgi:hypothetical protein
MSKLTYVASPMLTVLTLQKHWALVSNYCPRWSEFKFMVPLNAFTTYGTPRPALKG